SGTDSTPARSACRKKLTARKGARPSRRRSIVSSNVCAMNQNMLPTSRRKFQKTPPISWSAITGAAIRTSSVEFCFFPAITKRKLPQYRKRKRASGRLGNFEARRFESGRNRSGGAHVRRRSAFQRRQRLGLLGRGHQ